jgi:hypothetical protein
LPPLREQLIEDITDTRQSMDQHVCRLQELLESEDWDLAIHVLRELKDSVWMMGIVTNKLADLEEE